MNAIERVTACIELHKKSAQLLAEVLPTAKGKTELEVHTLLQAALARRAELHPTGWYAPPPDGISVLFGAPDSGRSKFESLRRPAYWSGSDYIFDDQTFGTVYMSPVDRASGMIGDINMSFYAGDDPAVREHIKHCLETVEATTDLAQVGMSFRELHAKTADLLTNSGLNNNWTKTTNDPLGTDFGHSIPWSYEDPTAEEQRAIERLPIEKLKDVISSKRLYVNVAEEFVIPETAAFTLEIQCSSTERPELPNAYFHTIVTFRDGHKHITTDFNPVFEALGIDYIRSRF
jgi:Metallopeptidase family M24